MRKKKHTRTTKKIGRKSAYLCFSTRSEDFSPVGRSRHDEENGKILMAAKNETFFLWKKWSKLGGIDRVVAENIYCDIHKYGTRPKNVGGGGRSTLS